MRLSIFLIIVLAVFSCEKKSNRFGYDPKWDLATKIYDNEIGKMMFSQLKAEKKLNVIESGASFRGREKFHCMHCGFQYFDEITLEEARKLLVNVSNLYLKTINENENIRPFLNNYPFQLENIEIRIFIYDSRGKSPDKGKLKYITMQEGKFRYSIGELDSNGWSKVICEETYEEAKANMGR